MKSGLEFFPLDVTLDTKFELIEAEFGITGFAVIVKLFQMIYGQEGYYGEVNDEVVLLFSKKNALGRSTVSEIIRAAVRRGIFDKGLYNKYKILTSEGIQKRYFEACRRREKIEVRKEYLLGSVYQNFKNVHISDKIVNISDKNVNNFKQSKESKVEYSKVERESTPARNKYGEYLNVLLTDDEFEDLKIKCPLWKEYIERISKYMADNNKNYASHYKTILLWYEDDKKAGKTPKLETAPSYNLEQRIQEINATPLKYERRK